MCGCESSARVGSATGEHFRDLGNDAQVLDVRGKELDWLEAGGGRIG